MLEFGPILQLPSTARWRTPLFSCCLVWVTIVRLAAFQDVRSVNTGNPSTIEDFKAGDANREYQRATDIVNALQLASGDWAADVGAGGGYYSMRMAEKVGATGKVFAEDVTDSSMKWLNLRVSLFNLSNVEILEETKKTHICPPHVCLAF